MAISVKSKFAGFLRGLVGRGANSVTQAAKPTPAPAPVASANPQSASTPPPPPAPTQRPVNSNEIELPLASVVACLPMDLRAKLMAAPPAGLNVHLPVETVINQLAFGAVKISFGELRHLAPGIFVNSGGEYDNKLVSLPLQEILSRLNPTLLSRRSSQKVEVADEIVGPFAERGRGLTFTTKPLKAPSSPVPPPAPQPESPVAFTPAPAREIAPPATPPAAPQFAQPFPRSITPASSQTGTSGASQSHSLPPSPIPPRGITPAIGTNGNGHSHSNGNGHGHSPSQPSVQPPTLPSGLRLASNGGTQPPPPLKLSALPDSTAASTPAPAAPRAPTLFVTLGDLCDGWPESLRDEILKSSLAQTNVPLDGALILPGLKRGRIVMPWKQIRLLAQPSSAPSPNDHLELELPLKVIAPLFLAAQKNPMRPQTKASVSSDIPDLFFGFPQAAPAPAAPVVPPLPKQAESKASDSNFYVWGEGGEPPQADDTSLRRAEVPQTDFMNRGAHPREVVERAVTLPGVAGAVVAMQDGLRVASQVPSQFNADTLAAFLPQIFDRVNQSTRELRMGALNNINFTVGNVPWKIFRVNAVYFAAFGRAGESLPSVQLAQLAAELDRKKQQ